MTERELERWLAAWFSRRGRGGTFVPTVRSWATGRNSPDFGSPHIRVNGDSISLEELARDLIEELRP